MSQSKEFAQAFYDADHEAFKKAKPALERIFQEKGIETKIVETEDGNRVDVLITATTSSLIEVPYTIELKNREGRYTFELFWNEEEAGTGTLGQGQLIKQKKIDALLRHNAEGRRAYYCLYFPDDVIALWKIDEDTKYGEITLYYDKYNVHRGQKELQTCKTLKLHDADLIYDVKNNRRLK